MSAFCLPKFYTSKFLEALKNGSVDPAKLAEMTSEQRHAYFEGLIGKENAAPVNALFESKLLLKNQQAGFISWAKKTAGLTETARRDIISRIQRMDTALDAKSEATFLKDLASQKLGADVTFKEAQTIVEMSRNIEQSKSKIKPNEPAGSANRLEYGLQVALLKDYVGELKLKNDKIVLRDFADPVFAAKKLSGVLKSIQSSLDNSYFGIQAVKNLLDPKTSGIWINNFVKSWGDFKKELTGNDAMLAVKSDVYSRPNALNGKYDKMDVAIGLATEEAYPSSLPTHVPLLGRLFKASEAAYNGAALRMRADLADALIKSAETNGIDILANKTEAKALGEFVNSATGRGSLGKAENLAENLNLFLYSAKFLKSNIDFLTAPLKVARDMAVGKEVTYAAKQAAFKTMRVVSVLAGIMTIANTLWPGSVETDPRSSHFGKIKIGDRWFDISGKAGSLVTLASRVVPSWHNGKFGWWVKNSKGKYTEISTGKFGVPTAVDYLESFAEGRAAPLAGTLLTILKQKDFEGNKPSVEGTIKNAAVPFSAQTLDKLLNDPKSDGADILLTMIAETLGFTSSK